MDKCSGNGQQDHSASGSRATGGGGCRKNPSPKSRNIVRDLLKESSLSSDDTEFMDLPLPALPKTVEDLALNRRSVVDVENLDVHPCVAAFLMSRMEYYIGLAPFFYYLLLLLLFSSLFCFYSPKILSSITSWVLVPTTCHTHQVL